MESILCCDIFLQLKAGVQIVGLSELNSKVLSGELKNLFSLILLWKVIPAQYILENVHRFSKHY